MSKACNRMAAIAAGLVSACASSPSIGVLGAYFPDWLFCIVASVVLTVVIYLIVKRLEVDHLMDLRPWCIPRLSLSSRSLSGLMLFQH